MAHRRNGAAGFTLIEVIVALAVLSIVMITIFKVYAGGLAGLRRSDDGQRAAIVAQGLLAQLGSAIPLRPEGRLTGRSGAYDWTIETSLYRPGAGNELLAIGTGIVPRAASTTSQSGASQSGAGATATPAAGGPESQSSANAALTLVRIAVGQPGRAVFELASLRLIALSGGP